MTSMLGRRRPQKTMRIVGAFVVAILAAETLRETVLGRGVNAIPRPRGERPELLVRAAAQPVACRQCQRGAKLSLGRGIVERGQRRPVGERPARLFTERTRPRVV